MSAVSAVLSMPYIAPSQAQKHVTHNEALRVLDVVTQLSVTNRTLSAPPNEPATGDCYIIGNSATDAWAGHDGEVATYEDSYWSFVPPQEGWRAWVAAEASLVIYQSGAWALWPGQLNNITHLGVMTSADDTNRLAVSADATLLTHAGAGHQLKVNKATAGDTNSLLFQTNWSGRAEMGLAGSDDFAIKTSADGSAWVTALSFDAASGLVTGAAVQSSADDTTQGRLMRADYGYGPGNILGTVSQTSGTPTGAVIESGAGYTRFADGTQICTGTLTLNQSDPATVSGVFSYAQGFVATPVVSAMLDASSTTGLTPVDDALLAVTAATSGGTSATLSIKRVAGQTDFAAGDSCSVMVTAIGRWF